MCHLPVPFREMSLWGPGLPEGEGGTSPSKQTAACLCKHRAINESSRQAGGILCVAGSQSPPVTMEARALWLLAVVLALGSSSLSGEYVGLCK